MKVCSRIIALTLLCLALATAPAWSCVCADATTDFSRRGYNPKIISAAEFLQDELGLELANGEENYLNSHPIFTIRYNDSIPSGVVKTDFDGTNVVVTPAAYDYIADSGQRVVWTAADVCGTPLDNGTATISAGGEDYVTVRYTASLTLDKQSVNGVLNQYYYAAKVQSDRAKLYNKQSADYNAYLAALDNYNNVLLPQYNEYLKEYADWKRRDDPYQAYLAEYEQYLEELYAYENYDPVKAQAQYEEDMARYQQYLVEMERYNALAEQYRQLLDTPEVAKLYDQLAILEYIYAECDGRSLRGAIMGDTVTAVLSRKDELKIASGEAAAVDAADRATRNLRNLISNYEQCATDEAKYAFYLTTYTYLKRDFSNLLRCLDYFYRVDFIRNFITEKGKDNAYRILLAQLYEIANALDDEKVGNYEQFFKFRHPNAAYFDENYRIGGNTPESILGDCLLTDTNDAVPIENGITLFPTEPTPPQEVTEPTPPERSPKPVAPQEVESPGPAPQEVPQPQMPAAVPAPDDYNPTDEEKALQRAFDDGLRLREEFSEDYVVEIETWVKKFFRNYESVTVYFYDSLQAAECYFQAETERGGFVEQPNELPTAEKTGYVCTFDGWIYEDGTDVDWSDLRDGSELRVYPKFVETPNLYDVIWVVNGAEYRQKAPYGEIPQFDGVPVKPDDPDGRQYRFVGWDRQPVAVTEQTDRYTALFEASTLIVWEVDGEKTVTPVWKGELPAYPFGTPEREHNSMYVYVFVDWNKPITEANGDATYVAVFRQSAIMSADGRPAAIEFDGEVYTANFVAADQNRIDISCLLEIAERAEAGVTLNCNRGSVVLSVSALDVYNLRRAEAKYYTFNRYQTGNMEYGYYLQFFGESGPVGADCSIRASISGEFSPTNSRLYRLDRDVLTSVRMTTDDGHISFAMNPDVTYRVMTRFNLYIAEASSSLLSASAYSDLLRDDVITITVGDIPVGVNLERLYAVDMYGNEVAFGDNKLTMPESDVTVFAVLSDIYYTVTFKSEDNTVSVRSYRYGETIVPPANPVKAPDGEYSYIFDKWDKPLTVVTGDAEYNAVFKAMPLESLGNGGMSSLMKLIISFGTIGGAALIALAVALPLLIIRKKRKKSQMSTAAAQAETSVSEQPSDANETDDMPSEKR